ncbi:MAG: hypothetical protein ACO1RX_22795 [Candidatus Sericytochromatia bacterium]
MKRFALLAPLFSALLILSACQAPLLTQTRHAQTAQSLSLNTSQAPGVQIDGQVHIVATGQNARVTFQPRQTAAFSLQALRRSEIQSYRMTVLWSGDATGRSTTVAADAAGHLPSDITVAGVPSGSLRVVLIDALDNSGTPLLDLRAGWVYNQTSSGDYDATTRVTRAGRAVAETIQHFANSNTSGDRSIFAVWQGNPAGTVADLEALVNTVLTDKDPLALASAELIAAIQAKGDGSLPDAGDVETASATGLTLNYEVPSGYLLPAGARLSLNMASSPTAVIPAPQPAGTYSVTIPEVYLPQGAHTDSRVLRLFAADDTGYQTPLYSPDGEALALNTSGIASGTPGASALTPLTLPTAMLTPLATGSTFYVSNTGSNTQDGSSEALAWQTLAHALAQIKARTATGAFAASTPVLIVKAGTYSESPLTLDFPLHLIGESGASVISPVLGTGTGFALSTDNTDSDFATSATQRISLSNLTLTGFDSGLSLSNSHVTLTGITATGTGALATGTGILVNANTTVDDLVITHSAFDAFQIGFAALAADDDASNLTHLTVSNTRFNDNRFKGVYLEKASNATFDGITIAHSGYDAALNGNMGFELNLKGSTNVALPKAFGNIQLLNSSVTDSGYQGTSTFPAAYARAAVGIKAREVATNYVSLTGVTLRNNTISGPMQALRIAAPDSNAGVSSSMMANLSLSDNRLALENNLGYTGEQRFLLINHTLGEIDASQDNRFDGVNPASASAAEAYAIEAHILDALDDNVYQNNAFVSGRVFTGLAGNRTFVPFRADARHIQPAIDAAEAGDTLVLQAGTYTPAQTLTLTLNKDITLEGEGDTTRFERAVSSAPSDSLFRLSAGGATLRNLAIEKMQKTGPDALIYLGANDLTVENMTLSGQFENGDGDVSRAMVGQAGITGLLVQDNLIYGLRQPAYISAANGITGSILNNQVYGTRGWVIEGAQINFSGNTWRSDDLPGASGNFGCDIALLARGNAPVPADYMAFYGDTTALEAANAGDLLDVTGPGMGGCDQR